MAKINWTSVAAGDLPTQSVAAALKQSQDAFDAITKNEAQKAELRMEAKKLKAKKAAAAAARASISKANAKKQADKLSKILRQKENKKLFETLKNDNSKRLSTKEIREKLAKNKEYSELSPKKQQEVALRYQEALKKDGRSIRDYRNVANDYRNALYDNPSMGADDIEKSLKRHMEFTYPAASKDQQNMLLNSLKLQLQQEGRFNPKGSRAVSNAEADKIIDRISTRFGLPDRASTVLGIRLDGMTSPSSYGQFTPAKTDVAAIIAQMRENGITDPAAIENTLQLAFDKNGNVRSGFDWRDTENQKALFERARAASLQPQQDLINIPGSMAQIQQAGQPQIMSADSVVNEMLKYLKDPQQALQRQVQKGYNDAGGQGAVTTPLPPVPGFDPTEIPANRDMAGNALEQLGLVTPEQAVKLEQDAPGYQPDESGYVPIGFNQPQVPLNLGRTEVGDVPDRGVINFNVGPTPMANSGQNSGQNPNALYQELLRARAAEAFQMAHPPEPEIQEPVVVESSPEPEEEYTPSFNGL